MQSKETKIAYWVLSAGLLLRLYGIWLPFQDAFAERQAQVAIVARNFYLHGVNILYPQIDIFGPGGGACVLEFPLVPALAAILYNIFGEHEFVARLICVAFSMGSLYLLFLTAKRLLGGNAALWALGLAALSPLDIYMGRAFQGEASMMFFSVAALYLLLKWMESDRFYWLLLSAMSAALALVTKPTAAVILAPIFALFISRKGWKTLASPWPWWYGLISFAPLIAWAAWARHVNSQNPNLPEAWANWGDILTKYGSVAKVWITPVYWAKMGISLAGVLLGPIGFLGFVAGLTLLVAREERLVFYSWTAAICAYFLALPGANAGHPYYQLPLLPCAAMLFGVAATRLPNTAMVKSWVAWPKFKAAALSLAAAAFLGYAVGYFVFFNYMYDTKIRMPYVREVSRIIAEETPAGGALIINQPAASTTVLTYYCRKPSWSFNIGNGNGSIAALEDLRAKGGSVFISIDTRYASGMAQAKSNGAFWDYLNRRYKQVALTEHYAIFDLRETRC